MSRARLQPVVPFVKPTKQELWLAKEHLKRWRYLTKREAFPLVQEMKRSLDARLYRMGRAADLAVCRYMTRHAVYGAFAERVAEALTEAEVQQLLTAPRVTVLRVCRRVHERMTR